MKARVAKAAATLNYRHNSHAANLRQGSTKTIGVIVPHINQSFFSEAIAGMEEACYKNKHSLIICQSHESYRQECNMIDTLIHQNVDCIIISVSAETKSSAHLETIARNHITLIQFDRYIDELESFKVLNDNEEAAYKVVKQLVKEGYRKIAFLGGPLHLTTFADRKKGYIRAIKEEKLLIPFNYIVDDVLGPEKPVSAIKELLTLPDPPDAFLTVSDHQSLAVMRVATSLNIRVPEQLGIFGFANEVFTELLTPTLSSVDQKSKDLGRRAVDVYFKTISKEATKTAVSKAEILQSEIIVRDSSRRLSQ